MDQIPNEIHKNLIPTEISNYRLPYGMNRGVGAGPADPATTGPKFLVHQESPQLILYINCNQATLKLYFTAACLY